MLKIKKDIDLTRLEEYGFKFSELPNTRYDDSPYWEYDLKDNRTYFVVDKETRELGISTSLYGDIPSRYIYNLDILYDLIKDGFIEARR